jgi:hypothetical protein
MWYVHSARIKRVAFLGGHPVVIYALINLKEENEIFQNANSNSPLLSVWHWECERGMYTGQHDRGFGIPGLGEGRPGRSKGATYTNESIRIVMQRNNKQTRKHGLRLSCLILILLL